MYSCSDEPPPSGTPCRRSTWTRRPESLVFLVDHRRNWNYSTSSACSELVLTVQVYVSSPSFYTSSICPTHTFSKTLWNIISRISNPQNIGLQGDLLQSILSLSNFPPTFSTDPLESRTQCRYTEQEQSVMLGITTTVRPAITIFARFTGGTAQILIISKSGFLRPWARKEMP